MLSPKNILSINNLEAQDNLKERYTVTTKCLGCHHLEKIKRLEPECTISYQEYLLISKCTNNCNINDIKHLGLWSEI